MFKTFFAALMLFSGGIAYADEDVFYEISKDVAKTLDSHGILVRYNFTDYEDTVAEEFIVHKGRGSTVESLLSKAAKEHNYHGEISLTIIENDDEDIVTWFHDIE